MSSNKSITGYVLLGLSLVIAFFYNYQRAQVHMTSAWDYIPGIIMKLLVLGLVFIIGLVGVVLVYSSGDTKKGVVIIVYLVGISATFYYLHVKTTESKVPAYIVASGPHVSLKLRKDSSYRIMNYGYHMAESWQEGTYSLQGNKITLICDGPVEAGLDRELWIRRDTIFYRDAGSDAMRVEEGFYLAIQK